MKRVLVPLDGTKNAETAVEFLKRVCEPGDSVVLLTVRKPETPERIGSRPGQYVAGAAMGPSGGVMDLVTPDTSVFDETVNQVAERQVSEAQDEMEHLAQDLREAKLQVKTDVMLSPSPADAIIHYAREDRPTFIAMLRRTHLGLSELFFGSVAKDVMESEVAPVLLVPPPGR